MSDTSLLKQLANRCLEFHRQTGISQVQVAKAINVADGNYSAFLNGKRGIGAEAICRLLEFTGLTREQAIAKFSKPVFSASIAHFQECGKPLRFANPGWKPEVGNSAADPVHSTDITSTRDAQRQAVDNLLAVLAELDEMARVAVLGSIAKAYPNPLGITPHNGQRFSRKR
jgi:hypothetical protein